MPDETSRKKVIERLAKAEETLAEARQAHGRRRVKQTIRRSHLACYHAATALWAGIGISPVRDGDDYDLSSVLNSSSTKSLAAFYHRLCLVKGRILADSDGQVHIEEATN